MPDYGHPLRFGSFITPVNAPASRPGELAVLSEELGLDLVTFQDHPYQASFLDTWTLLTWVAARTDRVNLAGNVLNLPLRQPAVLARAAASLDLLSGGRVSLGLGSGAFWDAIEAMGGQRLTPGQSVEALSEAIDVIRKIWDVEKALPMRAGGSFHQVNGAQPGPAPAHPIPLWLGAYKPRMLRLVAQKADGWLPSLAYLQPGDLARGNQVIDDSARENGREPAEIVRLLNISPDQGADDLVRLATEDGVSTFILASDDPRQLTHFAREIVPAVRDRVSQSRSQNQVATVGRIRGAAQLSRRRPHIDYDGLPASLAENAVEPGEPAYARYTSGYLRGGAPGLVLRPQNIEQVREAVVFAARHREVPLGVFSSGHGLSGRSLNDGGLVIDVGVLRTIELLDAREGLVRIGPGARWVEVARALSPHGLALTSGDFGGVGVGGLATAGGLGWFAREHGLTLDHLRSVDVVLADGTLKHASPEENPDLFWAMRGAGANFGIAVSFEFAAVPVGKVAFAQLAFEVPDTAAFLHDWGTVIEAAHRSVTGQVILGPPRGGRQVAQAMILVDNDDPDTIVERLQPIADIAPLLDQSVGLATYEEIIGAFHSDQPQQGRGEPLAHSGNLVHLTPEFGRDAARLLESGASYFFQIRAVGGAVADVPADATAYGWRDANFSVVAFGSPGSGFDRHWDRLIPHFEGLYLSFEAAQGDDVLARAFPPAHLTRLRGLKRRYDPTGLFRDNFFIDPA